jgi:hypothetical protein
MSNYYPGVQQQGTTSANSTQKSAATTTQTISVAGSAGSKIVVRKVVLFGSAASTATLQVKQGTTVIVDLGTVSFATQGTVFDLNPTTLADGTTLNVVVGAAVAGTTTLSVIADKV